jgi:hypothetical protein
MTFKNISYAAVIAAAASAIVFGATAARADYNGGGKVTADKNMCWKMTDAHDFGYWATCPKPMKVGHMSKKKTAKK